MGVHLWSYKTKRDWKRKKFDTAEHNFLFRVFDYNAPVLTSYEQAEKYILETLEKSTNDEAPLVSNNPNMFLTFTAEMTGNILLASDKEDDYEYKDPTLTLQRVKDFFERYPDGVIEFG